MGPRFRVCEDCRDDPYIAHPVIPAQAGIQRFHSLAPCSSQGQALGPRFRGSDELAGRLHFFTRSFAGEKESRESSVWLAPLDDATIRLFASV